MKTQFRIIAYIILLTGLSGSGTRGQTLPFHTYTTVDGLAANDIRVLRQDSRGFIWIGTTEGVSVYDEHAFTNYTTNDGLSFNAINDIIEDRTSPGTMWIATNGGGVNRYHGNI